MWLTPTQTPVQSVNLCHADLHPPARSVARSARDAMLPSTLGGRHSGSGSGTVASTGRPDPAVSPFVAGTTCRRSSPATNPRRQVRRLGAGVRAAPDVRPVGAVPRAASVCARDSYCVLVTPHERTLLNHSPCTHASSATL